MIGFILGTDTPNNDQIITSDLNNDEEINILDIVIVIDLIFEE